MDKAIALIFPHQLFEKHPVLQYAKKIYLIEDKRFFTDFKFHKKKLILHRASMMAYKDFLEHHNFDVEYISYNVDWEALLKSRRVKSIIYCDTVDKELENRLQQINILKKILETPAFLSPINWLKQVFKGKKHYSLTSFYIQQRKRMRLLMENEKPVGGKWTYDTENREKLSENIEVPKLLKIKTNKYVEEAKIYVEKHFHSNYGIEEEFIYPIVPDEVKRWFYDFLENRFEKFGIYEDSIHEKENFLFHSVLSYALNVGLITPKEVIDITLDYIEQNEVPLNAVEGFIRQIVGWREFIRAIYIFEGKKQSKLNFWQHKKTMPKAFYRASTGILPVDTVIKRLFRYGYLHHIERLMVLSNFMLLCEIDPNEIYEWFMELFIDAYDWVMVPNIYGLALYSDGGLMSTKPYISSSNYIKKMSNFKEGNWCGIWDGLYWKFISNHQEFIETNPRLRVMVSYLARIGEEKLKSHIRTAENYMDILWKQ